MLCHVIVTWCHGLQSLVDDVGREAINNKAELYRVAVEREEWGDASTRYWHVYNEAKQRTGCVNFYNVLKHETECKTNKERRMSPGNK